MRKKKLIIYSIIMFLSLIVLIIISVFTVELIKSEGKDITNQADILESIKTDDEADSAVNQEFSEENTEFNDDDGSFINTDNNKTVYEDKNTADNQNVRIKEVKAKKSNSKAHPDNNDARNDPKKNKTEGISLDVRDIEKPENEKDIITYGIDVAKWQGIIDWKKVKDSGIDFAMIRVGYRTQVDGDIMEDPYAKYNLQEAQKYGIKIGVYFFSSAINKKEAKEEAKWVVKFIAPYKITYPVAYNCEGFSDPQNRQYGMNKEERSKLAKVFLDYIKEKGYTPMFYGAKSELEDSKDWDTDGLTGKYKIWVAQYPTSMDSADQKSSYSKPHDMWQYTDNGKVPGIKGSVDLNIAYFGYEKEAEAKDDTPVKEVTADPTALINFKEVNETVTAKEVTNLRNLPNTSDDSKVIAVLYYGDTATRTGIGDNGWSRVEYKGNILYAVTSYLTTDLNYKENSKPTVENPEAGITFKEVSDKVTAKIETNLRLVPSTESNETIYNH